MDPKTFSDMMEQQRQFYAKLQHTLAPHSEWMAKLAQQMSTVDPAVLENLQKSKAAMEAAMAEHVKNIQAYEEALKPQMQKMQDTATAAMASSLRSRQGGFRPPARLDETIRASLGNANEGVRRRYGECGEGLVGVSGQG
jgi:cobalamin biosynthesis Mg chelatase CobN